jgi:hypothetical protein
VSHGPGNDQDATDATGNADGYHQEGYFLNIEGKAKATAAVPQPKPGVVKTYYKSLRIPMKVISVPG